MKNNPLDESRRDFLWQALSSGLLVGGLGWPSLARAETTSGKAVRLPEGRSIYRLEGDVTVNGKRAATSTLIQAGDAVRVGKDSRLVAAVGDTAFLMRPNSTLRIGGLRLLVRSLQATGELLGVYGRRREQEAIQLRTVTATIGIRGTGVYIEADAEKTYVCTCYGQVDIGADKNPGEREIITAQHHDAPRWVYAQPQNGRRIVPAGFRNHTDDELIFLEALVGREVPFKAGAPAYGEDYERPRREDY